MLPSIELRLAAIPPPPGLGQSCRRTRRRRVLRVRATVRRISNLEKCVAEIDDKCKAPVGHAKSVTTDGLNTPPKDLLDHSAVPAAVIRHPATENMLTIPRFPFPTKPPETCDDMGILHRISLLERAMDKYATVQSLCDLSDEVDVKVGKLSERLLIGNCALDRCKRDVQKCAKRLSYLEDALNLCITSQSVSAMHDACVAQINEIYDKMVTLSNTVDRCATSDAVEHVLNVATNTTIEAVFEDIDKLVQTNISALFAQQADLFHDQLLTELKMDLTNTSANSVPTIRQDSMAIVSPDIDQKLEEIHAELKLDMEEFRAELKLDMEAFDKKIDSKVTNKLERKIDAKLAPKAIEDRAVKRVQGTVMTVLDNHLNSIVELRVKEMLSSR